MTGELDEFEKAWEQDAWTEGADEPERSEEQEGAEQAGEDQGAEQAGEEQAGEEDQGSGEEQDTEGEQSGEEQADDPAELRRQLERAEQRMKSWEGRLSKLARENEELKRQLNQGQQAAPQQRDTAGGDAGTQETGNSSGSGPASSDTNSQADDDLRTRIREEYGDEIAQYVDERARQIAQEATQQVDQRIAPLEQARQEVEAQQHWQAIQQAHPDVDQIAQSQDLHDWIESQPSYVADAARQVVQAGTAQQVVELLDRYKAERQQGQQQQKPDASKARAVPSRSSGPPKAKPTQDFDAAWDEF